MRPDRDPDPGLIRDIEPEQASGGAGWRMPGLRVRGTWPPPAGPRVAIVGARKPTPYGEAVAERLATDLGQAGVVIVSGLALGVDAAAHQGALEADAATIAVLGTGVDIVYPARHQELARRIVTQRGALVSQFPDGTPPRRDHFPRRNWTIAGLSQAVVVVEAAVGSGALITAEAALALDRTVLAVPGSVFSPLSVGCHQLLRDGAGLVQNARDVLQEIGVPSEVLDDPLGPPDHLGVELPSAGQDPLLMHLTDTLPTDPGALAGKLGLPVQQVLVRLSQAELQGRVRRVGGGYVRVHHRSRR
ncbi:MAG: DNA-processing protein DprA [Candidatus Dormibacteraeota bacterium]|nr:DNA-processing protein DprA [Candidatus Dormibacteraeota bacterium]MBO0745069.1 DNA-processing protein DprA [Candidatus Dormibacteraeota bacterium]